MTLLEEIQAKCSLEVIASRDHQVIADTVNVGRTKASNTEIGNGTILEVLGLVLGSQVLDVIYATPAYKYVVPLLEQGRLRIGSAVAQGAVQAFVTGGLLTQEEADRVKVLGTVPDPISEFDVRCALYAEDGTFLG